MRSILLSLMAFAVYLHTPMVSASVWYYDYTADTSLSYEDNFRLSEADEIDTTTNTLGLNLEVTNSTEISDLRGVLDFRANQYSESSIDDTETYGIYLSYKRRGEVLSQAINVTQTSESTTQTEFLDTGRILDGSKDTTTISPLIRYSLNERSSLSASLSYRNVSYDTVSLTEFTDNSLSFGWSYRLDETSSISSSYSVSEYDPENADTTDINSINVNYESRVSATTTYNAQVGFSDVDRPFDSESGSDLLLGANYKLDKRNNFSGTVSNSYQASGTGEVLDEDRLSFRWNHALSERLQLNFFSEAASNDNRDYFSVSAGSSYNFSRAFKFQTSVLFRDQETPLENADSISLYFSLSYSPTQEIEEVVIQ